MGRRRAFIPRWTMEALEWESLGTWRLMAQWFQVPDETDWIVEQDVEQLGVHVILTHPRFPDGGEPPPEEIWDDGGEGLTVQGSCEGRGARHDA